MKQDYRINQNTYNEVAQDYAENAYAKQWMKMYVEDFATHLEPKSKVLDLGCGPGNDSLLFTEFGFEVTGVDFSSKMIEEAKKRVPEATFILSDLNEIAFDYKSFNAFWSVGALHHVDKDDLKQIMTKVYAWLKPDSPCFLSIKSGSRKGVENQVQIGTNSKNIHQKYWVYWQEEELNQTLRLIGFKNIKIEKSKPERKSDLPIGFTEFWLNTWFHK